MSPLRISQAGTLQHVAPTPSVSANGNMGIAAGWLFGSVAVGVASGVYGVRAHVGWVIAISAIGIVPAFWCFLVTRRRAIREGKAAASPAFLTWWRRRALPLLLLNIVTTCLAAAIAGRDYYYSH
jgi:Na+/melibiose symporter-like transporter